MHKTFKTILTKLKEVFSSIPLHPLLTACSSSQSLPSSTAGSWRGSAGSLATVSHLYSITLQLTTVDIEITLHVIMVDTEIIPT